MNGIRLAEKRDIPALCEIWKACFNDPEDYIEFFYRENFGCVTAAVYVIDDRPVSMLHWFDSSFVNGDVRSCAKYLYAGGTAPEYRRNGYYGELFRYVKDLAKNNGFALFGKPARRELIPYYQTLGFEPDACFRLITVQPDGIVPVGISPLSPEKYNRMRNRVFSSRPYAEWPDRYVRFCVKENAYFGGLTAAVTLDGEEHFIMCAPEGKTLRITETSLSPDALQRACGALCGMFKTDFIKAYMPEHVCGEGEEIVSSIVYNAPLNNTYVNLILI